jgi:peptidoglycan/xylan/chitin deacetylase (PgdA/CDA1 family)
MSLVTEEPLPAAGEGGIPVETAPPRVPRGGPRRAGLKHRALSWLSAGMGACLGPREPQAVGILMYHRIANPVPDHPPPTYNVTPARFESQLRGLLDRGWQAWPLRQVLSCHARELPIPRKTFVVTFDDGYANVLIHACPILTKLHIPATMFLATAYLDSPYPLPSDDWPAAGRPGVPREAWRPLTTEECRRLAANGLVELAAHTHTHADFRGQPEALLADLRQNLAVLQERFNVGEPAFAFPYGTTAEGFAGGELARAAREAGVACALNTDGELVRPGDDPFHWPRLEVEDWDTAATLAGKLGGWRSALRTLGRRALNSRPRRAWA